MSELLKDEELLEVLEEEEQITFVVDDDQKAEWCLAKIREAEAEKQRWKEFYEDRLAKVNAAEDAKIERMRFFLEQYFRTVPHKETKTQQSYQLPSGKLVLKHQAPEVERDDDQLIPWLRENYEGDYVKTKESVDWSALKKAFQDDELIGVIGENYVTHDGEIIPGITVTERPDVFKVEVK